MNSEKYIGLDVHQATIVVAVTDSTGKLVVESILETEAATILQFFAGLRGNLSVTFEEGTWSVWLYDLLNPHVDKLVVCNPRKNALLKDGNKNDRIDARKLAELLRGNQLKPVYHGENGVRMLRELCGDERNDSMSNWTCCNTCGRRHGGSCWRKIASMPSLRG
jgi:transposase